MKTNTLYPFLNLKYFYEFIKMNRNEQGLLLKEQGVLLDFDSEKEITTRLYFLQGFFVEEIFCREQNEIIDVIPYKQGYRIERFLKAQYCSLNERPMYFQYCIN